MSTNAAAKIEMMNNSMRCFVFGLLGLLPIIGLPFALAALWYSGRIRSSEQKLWNPAKPYRVAGIGSAALGLIFWSFVLILVVWRALSPSPNNF